MKRQIVLIISLVAGLIAAILTRAYLTVMESEIKAEKARLQKKYGVIEVLAFAHDVPSGSVLAKADFGRLKVPEMGLRGQAVMKTDLELVVGRKLLNGYKANEVLFWSDVEGGDPHAKGLSADVKRQMRAMSINVNGAASVSGMVKPNDHVDVIASYATPKVAEDGHTMIQELSTRTILQNVLVLATGKETAKSAIARNDAFGGGGTYATITLEVSPREAELLVFYEQIKGRISLALRNRDDTYYEKELPQIDIKKIGEEIEDLNKKRQSELNGGY